MNFLEIIKDLVFNYFPAILHQLYLLLFYGLTAALDYRHKFFSKLLENFPLIYNKKVEHRKRQLFQSLESIISNDAELRKKGQIRILEIGIGPGANLNYYPKNCHLIAVEPNKYFEGSLRKNLENHKGITLEAFVEVAGENMIEIESSSVDAVVTSLVACSVQNLDKMLSEIQRVLVNNGRYYFMEHVSFESRSWKCLMQQILNMTRIWPLLFDGCMFQRRSMMKNTCSVYFTRLEEYEEFYIDTSGLWVFQLLSPHVSGIAVN